MEEAVQARSSLPRLVAMMVRNPYLTVNAVVREVGLTKQGARNLIQSAVNKGWLESLGTRGRGRREYWYAPEIFMILEAPMSYAGS